MNNGITELVFILDRSGSMSGLENDTIGGFNSLIKKQRLLDAKCYVTTVLFDNYCQMIHDRLELGLIPDMTGNEYFVRGSTALLDCIGWAISHIDSIHKYLRREDVPEHTMFVITTDGMENSSTLYTRETIKQMIEDRTQRLGWEFLFIGANIDAVGTATSYGIKADRAVTYCPDPIGTGVVYNAVSGAVRDMRNAMPYSTCWRDDIEDDLKKRKP